MEQSIAFHSYFESVDWMVGKKGNAKPMKNWKSALTGWINRSKSSKVDSAISNQGQDVINKLWVRMTEIYGHKWVSSYGSKPNKPWTDFIRNLPNMKIAHGLNEIIKEGSDWPPSLSKFNKMCQSYQKKQVALPYLSKNDVVALRAMTQGKRHAAMDKINKILAV